VAGVSTLKTEQSFAKVCGCNNPNKSEVNSL